MFAVKVRSCWDNALTLVMLNIHSADYYCTFLHCMYHDREYSVTTGVLRCQL